MRAFGKIDFDGQKFRPTFLMSARHKPQRLVPCDSEDVALAQLRLHAEWLQVGISIQAGYYPKGTRQRRGHRDRISRG